jgi:TonB family protein
LNVIRLADRINTTRKPGLADFKPKIGGEEAGRGRRFRISRSVVVIVVVGAHVVAGAMFAIPVIKRVMLEPPPAEVAGPPVAMVQMAISQQNDEAARVRPGTETRPPVLRPAPAAGRLESPTERARRAGIPVANPSRALLLVRVTEEGKPSEVAVAETSGDARLDQVAVEYARALEWSPAVVAGRKSTMSIRLPVEFDAGS